MSLFFSWNTSLILQRAVLFLNSSSRRVFFAFIKFAAMNYKKATLIFLSHYSILRRNQTATQIWLNADKNTPFKHFESKDVIFCNRLLSSRLTLNLKHDFTAFMCLLLLRSVILIVFCTAEKLIHVSAIFWH